VVARADADADYRLDVPALEEWERSNGRIPDGVIVLLRTGWSSRWPDKARYLGTTKTGPAGVPELHFPGIDSSAARWLAAERRVKAVGIDTPSIDYGQSTTFDTHRSLFAQNIPAFENVASLERLPPTGAYVVALPMKIRGGSGGPLRIVALVP
jgi:kynurenine formamidase